MSYLHCPSCKCAYNVAQQPSCPACGVAPGARPADPADDVVQAAHQLARAISRATPAQLAAAADRLDDRRALTAVASVVREAPIGALSAVRAALAPPPAPTPLLPAPVRHAQALLATVALALVARLAAPRRSLLARARALLA